MGIKKQSNAPLPLPPDALSLLEQAGDTWIVAPVGLGYATGLIAWAKERGIPWGRTLGSLKPPAVWLPGSRGELAEHAPQLIREGAIFFSEAQLVLSPDLWRRLLPPLPEEAYLRLYEEVEGWPLALELASSHGILLPLHSHPGVLSSLQSLLPASLRELLQKASKSPLLLPPLYETLGLSPAEVALLYDLGYLVPRGPGLAMPKLLRLAIRGTISSQEARQIASCLAKAHREALGEAIATLIEAGLIEEALTLGAQWTDNLKRSDLERLLWAVPEALKDHPAYAYLAGRLARQSGHLALATELLQKAQVYEPLKAASWFELGLVWLRAQTPAKAKEAWEEALRLSPGFSLLRGKAAHNLAGYYLSEGVFSSAEQYAEEAAKTFQVLAYPELEAESLHIRALSLHSQGRLTEAEQNYQKAMRILAELGKPRSLLFNNLAELYILRGELDEARKALDTGYQFATGDPRAMGYLKVNHAWLCLLSGTIEEGENILRSMSTGGSEEEELKNERALVMARFARYRGDREEALTLLGDLPPSLARTMELTLLKEADPRSLEEEASKQGSLLELTASLLLQGKIEEAYPFLERENFGVLFLDPDLADYLLPLSSWDERLRRFFRIHIYGLGTFRITFAGRRYDLGSFPTRKAAALLVLLSLTREGFPSASLEEKLWPEVDNPKGNLATAVYHINRTFGTRVVEVRKGVVFLRYPASVDLLTLDSITDLPSLSKPILPELKDILPDEVLLFEAKRQRRFETLSREEAARVASYLESLLSQEPFALEERMRLIALYEELGQKHIAELHRKRLDQLLKR